MLKPDGGSGGSADGGNGGGQGKGGVSGTTGAGGTAGTGAGGTTGDGGASAAGGTTGDGGTNATGGTGGTAGTAGRGGASGTTGTAGRGGTGGSTAGAAAGSGGRGGQAGSASAGAGGSASGGTGGSAACTNTDTDKLNCGTCGHSCLGGDCAGGICQPFLLGTIPSESDYARQTIVTGGKVYVFTQVGQGSAGNAWQFDANVMSTPIEVMSGGSVGCIMNGTLFWVAYGTSNQTIKSCTFSNCTATTTTVTNLASGDYVGIYPGCDPTNNEIVWGISLPNGGYTIRRASATGTNARTITALTFPNDGASWSIANSAFFVTTDKLFYSRNDNATAKATLYYISTSAVNAQGVSLATVDGQILGGNAQGVVANGSIVLADVYTPAQVYRTISAPLPNGIISGSVPTFMAGNIFGGVVDQTTFYGSVSGSTVPTDAVVKCPLSNCSSPTIIARGQGYANYFAVDATAIYWTTSGTSSTALWKAAK